LLFGREVVYADCDPNSVGDSTRSSGSVYSARGA